MRGWAAALAVVLSALAAPASAQRTQAAAFSAEAVVVGLEAQYRAALIRERRLADDRQLRVIAEAETRMREARRTMANAHGDAAAAQTELANARADYARLVNAVQLQDTITRIEVEAFRAELEERLPAATPELIAAYQEFADGDRASAWSTLELLLRARASARVSAARAIAAGEVRQLARLREIMRTYGEATAAELLALWDQAAELDPRHSRTHIERARLERALNRLDAALRAAQAAAAAADGPGQQAAAIDEIGEVLVARNDLDSALTHYREGLEIRRRLAAEDPSNADRRRNVSVSVIKVGDVLRARNDLDGALTHYLEGMNITRRLWLSDHSNAERTRDVAVCVTKIGDLLMARNELDGALLHYEDSLELRRRLAAADPSNSERLRDVTVILDRIGDVLRARNYLDRALTHYRESLEIRRRLAAADPSNASRQTDVSAVSTKIGDALVASNDAEGALTHFRESLEIAHRLAAGDPSNASRLRAVWISLWRIARYGGGSWREVVEAIEDAQRRGLFNEVRDGSFLIEAREHAAGETQ